jgi:hypothetical protein
MVSLLLSQGKAYLICCEAHPRNPHATAKMATDDRNSPLGTLSSILWQ